jgi:hypothetical protein
MPGARAAGFSALNDGRCATRGRLAAVTRSFQCSEREERSAMAGGPWFFCIKHHAVETRDGCAERHRLGPYDTREEAEHALQSVAERNEKLDAEDRAWKDD